jgi:hypothetical protein
VSCKAVALAAPMSISSPALGVAVPMPTLPVKSVGLTNVRNAMSAVGLPKSMPPE